MVINDTELIVAVGSELRVMTLGEVKLNNKASRSYKVLHTPNLQFDVHQLALNPSGKLLAVAGAFQIAVVVLPRPGFTKLVPQVVDCKSIQVGQYHHATTDAAPIAKVEWHPWGEAGSTLMVMTTDGKLREYDISTDTEEPQQVVSFVQPRPPKKSKSYRVVDESEYEVASFTFGKGLADWGPLTVYAVLKSGDIYACCPYMPQNASIPSSYIHALECFVSAKQEFLAHMIPPPADMETYTRAYDYQYKYIKALLKQLPPGTVYPAASRPVLLHPPATIRTPTRIQGPFLLQPSPRDVDGTEGGYATDILYMKFGAEAEVGEEWQDEGETERLGLVLVTYQDGRVDVCLDVEKVEARWETTQTTPTDRNAELPMLAVYESVDLGLVSMLSSCQPPLLDLLAGNQPVLHADPIHDDTVYVYHAFGVHALYLDKLLRSLAAALHGDPTDKALLSSLEESEQTDVRPVVSTFSVERRSSNPVIAVSIPNDVYLTYSIFILTSSMRVVSFVLNLRSDALPEPSNPPERAASVPPPEKPLLLLPSGARAYTSLLGDKPFEPPAIFARQTGLPSQPLLALPPPPPNTGANAKEFRLTPDTLRYLGQTYERFSAQIQQVQLGYLAVQSRSALQKEEHERQARKFQEVMEKAKQLKTERREKTLRRVDEVKGEMNDLLARMKRVLGMIARKANPELSGVERRWFEELERMKEQVVGHGRYDESSLVARGKMVEHEYTRLLPHLRAEEEKEQLRKARDRNDEIGLSQMFEFGQQFEHEQRRIANLQKELQQLALKMDVTLPRPPPLSAGSKVG
ncbi:uncharacterized protein STEHIDRAFT_77614 [Stereum hirsutum FP-91666 SS1]|uniref:uncharacterized protein n=1 Tax=Stereum hirsutum (strain FP-91666) TaxID=721885 RepID=UPI000440FACC|nr:uncharacterized protein STEHIDRAFT_77614 [Stereum hirsutum FP-91666 SS1]EIM88529.1 hypothetical protein STEHIDRAFT_77614 [Stereum hirsutum FP-91666 SS1]